MERFSNINDPQIHLLSGKKADACIHTLHTHIHTRHYFHEAKGQMQLIEYDKEENNDFRVGKAKTQKILSGDESDHDVHTNDQN